MGKRARGGVWIEIRVERGQAQERLLVEEGEEHMLVPERDSESDAEWTRQRSVVFYCCRVSDAGLVFECNP